MCLLPAMACVCVKHITWLFPSPSPFSQCVPFVCVLYYTFPKTYSHSAVSLPPLYRQEKNKRTRRTRTLQHTPPIPSLSKSSLARRHLCLLRDIYLARHSSPPSDSCAYARSCLRHGAFAYRAYRAGLPVPRQRSRATWARRRQRFAVARLRSGGWLKVQQRDCSNDGFAQQTSS